MTGTDDREDDEPVVTHEVRCVDDDLREHRELAVEVLEDLHEDRDQEEQHSDQDERRERQHDRRIDHRALHTPLDLRVLLDLNGDAIEHDVERSRRLAGLDHRHVETVEHLRVARHRAREHDAALDVLANLGDHHGKLLVLGLVLEDEQRRDDAHAGLDQRRELAREDLQRLRLDLREADAATRRGRLLREHPREQAALAELILGRVFVGCVKHPFGLEPLGVDGGVSEGSHSFLSLAGPYFLTGRRYADP